MREILFRGKRTDNGKWIEGMPCSDLKGGVDAIQSNLGGGIFDIYPESLGQYTGLTDKNGIKVFEGDIVRLDEDVKMAFRVSDGEVMYCRGGFHVGTSDLLRSLNAIASCDWVLRGEVVGDIHDNMELLKKERLS
jgi:uncharacterized phage protein (TIGR01671 family)